MDESRIAVVWLIWLRWIAIAGQLLATLTAEYVFGVGLPLLPMISVIALTAVCNIAFHLWLHMSVKPRRLLRLGVLLDVLFLSVLLYLSGGPKNPFSSLYLIHVAIAVVLLGRHWAWAITILTAIAFGVIYYTNEPLQLMQNTPERLHKLDRAISGGQWLAVVIVSALITYFVSRVQKALRESDRQLIQVTEQAARSARMASLTTLAAGAAHELGTPLGTIAIVSRELELAIERANLDPNLAEDAKVIRTEVKRCRTILDRMRVDLGEDVRQPVTVMSAADLCTGAVAELPPEMRARIRVLTNDALPPANLPGRVIMRALEVLLKNAVDATPGESTIELSASKDETHWRFTVADQGQGMDAETLHRAGEPFFTTKGTGRGMGMGLFLVRLVGEQHEGGLGLESVLGQGTRATLRVAEPKTPTVTGETGDLT